ncbi:hypothetical protein ABZP36_015216 [Zizania latifolia]
MEHAAAGTATANNVGAELRLPEARLNDIILRWAFIDKAISGFGALAFAWATIVLLGGFSTLIKQKDFLWNMAEAVAAAATTNYEVDLGNLMAYNRSHHLAIASLSRFAPTA